MLVKKYKLKVRVGTGIRHRNLDTVRLLYFFVTGNNGPVSYSGVKGLRKHNKKTARRQRWGDAHTLSLGGNSFFVFKGAMQKRVRQGYPYLREPGRVLYFCDFNIWDSRFVASYECLTRCIQCHECDCHNRNGNQWRIDGFRTPIDSSHSLFDFNGIFRQTHVIKRA